MFNPSGTLAVEGWWIEVRREVCSGAGKANEIHAEAVGVSGASMRWLHSLSGVIVSGERRVIVYGNEKKAKEMNEAKE